MSALIRPDTSDELAGRTAGATRLTAGPARLARPQTDQWGTRRCASSRVSASSPGAARIMLTNQLVASSTNHATMTRRLPAAANTRPSVRPSGHLVGWLACRSTKANGYSVVRLERVSNRAFQPDSQPYPSIKPVLVCPCRGRRRRRNLFQLTRVCLASQTTKAKVNSTRDLRFAIRKRQQKHKWHLSLTTHASTDTLTRAPGEPNSAVVLC